MNVSDIYPSSPLSTLDDLSADRVLNTEMMTSFVIDLDLAMQAIPLVQPLAVV
jgi:hypothetical protein